jgi:hypothetical protein
MLDVFLGGRVDFVIAYSSEESLRDLVAAPSIVAFGFASRDEAVVAGRASLAATETNRPKSDLTGQHREQKQVGF